MRTVMVLNGKGGCGKTTIVTSLAGFYASRGAATVLKDYDPQGSSTEWLRHRPKNKQRIYGITAFKASTGMTRVWQMRIPVETDWLFIDSPAGVDLSRYADALKSVDHIIIPVVPSPIDIRATALFLKEVFTFMRAYPCRAKIGVVANRVTPQSRAFFTLQRIFANLDIPFIAALSENENYITAAEHGVSLLELDAKLIERDQEDWSPLLSWIEGRDKPQKRAASGRRAE